MQQPPQHLINELVNMGFARDKIITWYQVTQKQEALIEILLNEDIYTEQFKLEMEAAKKKEQDEIERAKRESLLFQQQQKNHILKTQYDPQYQEAIKRSQQEALGLDNSLREPNTPVGLLNIGNTCYFNCLLQSYFQNPALIKAILECKCQIQPQMSKIQQTSMKMLENLQKLILEIIGTPKKYADPKDVLNSILDDNGQPIKLGEQQDVGEFNNYFLTRLEEALGAQTLKDQYLIQIQETLSTGAVKMDSQTYITVNADHKNLYDALNKELYQLIDQSNITKNTKITKLPPQLMFGIQRTKFNNEKKLSEKNHCMFTFDSCIFMKAYMLGQDELLAKQGTIIEETQPQMDYIYRQMDSHTKWAQMNLSEAFAITLQYFQNQSIKSNQVRTTIDEIKKHKEKADKQDSSKLDEVKRLQEQRRQKLSQISPDYKLQTIIIHDGNPVCGHYFAYIFDFLTQQWTMYNDAVILPVTEQQVFEDAYGTKQKSAYFIIYTANHQQELIDGNQKFTNLQRMYHAFMNVEQANKVAQENIIIKAETEMDVVLKQLKETMAYCEQLIIQYQNRHQIHKSQFNDMPCLQNFSLYLLSLDQSLVLLHLMSRLVQDRYKIDIFNVKNKPLIDKLNQQATHRLYCDNSTKTKLATHKEEYGQQQQLLNQLLFIMEQLNNQAQDQLLIIRKTLILLVNFQEVASFRLIINDLSSIVVVKSLHEAKNLNEKSLQILKYVVQILISFSVQYPNFNKAVKSWLQSMDNQAISPIIQSLDDKKSDPHLLYDGSFIKVQGDTDPLEPQEDKLAQFIKQFDALKNGALKKYYEYSLKVKTNANESRQFLE